MPPKHGEKVSVDVVEIESSDGEEGTGIQTGSNRRSSEKEAWVHPSSKQLNPGLVGAASATSVGAPTSVALESRSFWKAGTYEVGPRKSAILRGELEHARVHPKFLHSNATSHKWAFGAIAELLDNAVDEICNGATFVKVDRIYSIRDNSPALLIQDDGGGMDPERLRKCMSLGYSSKTSSTTIGQYGNGFKTSTMRLGADVIVFTRASGPSQSTQSVGLLSYTFLRKTGQDDVIVPMIDFDTSDNWAGPLFYSSQDDWSTNLKTILEWSPFLSKNDLMQQFEDIGLHGTKIIIYNLWLNDEGIFELSFDDDDEDIRLRDEANRGSVSKKSKRDVELQAHISYRIRFSLRAYASVLYLQKFSNFKIILRGKPVEQVHIVDELKHPKVIMYKPQLTGTSKEVIMEATLGFVKGFPALSVSGYNVYHKNRLIRPFWKVTGDGSSRGNGVVGVLEANFIEPAHDKQDFERSCLFLRLETRLKQMVMEYWKSHIHLLGLHAVDGSKSVAEANATAQIAVGLSNTPHQFTSGGNPVPTAICTVDDRFQKKLDESLNGCGSSTFKRPCIPASFAVSAGFAGSHIVNESSRSIEQLCEENIQLFRRCEEHQQTENQLKHTVEELQKELEEIKKKTAQLAADFESQKKQKFMNL